MYVGPLLSHLVLGLTSAGNSEKGKGKGQSKLESLRPRWHPQKCFATSKPLTSFMCVIYKRSQPIIMEVERILAQGSKEPERRPGGGGAALA